MVVFHSDLDNTLIYSYKRDIGDRKKCVEIYEGREISFMTDISYALLKEIYKNVIFVPTTTRTIEQYNRIDLGIGVPEYALACNGGVLLVNGVEDEKWYQESLELVSDCQKEMQHAQALLEQDTYRTMEVRNIKNLFLFTKSKEPVQSVEKLSAALNLSLVDVFYNGEKVYVVPKNLNKGMAVKRFRQRKQADKIIAAGDSEFDISMLKEADIAFAPKSLTEMAFIREDVICPDDGEIFSDALLNRIKKM